MKKYSVLFVCVLLSAIFFTIDASGQRKEPFMTRAFSATSVKAVEVVTSGGSITVNGDAGSEAVVEVYVSRDNWSVAKIAQTLEENYLIEIKVEKGTLFVEAKPKSKTFNWNRQGLSISFKISVPKEVNTLLHTSGGSIRIAGVSGSQDFRTSGGSLTVENVSGNILGGTSGGSITITHSSENIELKTSGGSLKASDCSGKIYLRTSGGSIRLNDLSGHIDAATSGGSVTASQIEGTIKLGTSGGSMRLDGVSGNVDARTSGGSLNVEMELVQDWVKLSNSGNINLTLPSGTGYNLKVRANKIETSGLKDFRGEMNSGNLNGSVGNGGPEIEVRSSQRASLLFR